MILTVGNIKGGVGKTTIALNIAIARAAQNNDVLLIDGDEQHTAITFTELRNNLIGKTGYTAVSLQGASIRTQARQLVYKYTDIVIDVGGRDTGSLRAALTVTNVFLIPVQPRTFDIWAMDQVIDLIKEAREINNKLQAYAVINCADSQGSDNLQATEAIGDMKDIELMDVSIGRRKAFPNAAALGLSVIEQHPQDHKAVKEFNVLMKHLYNNETIYK